MKWFEGEGGEGREEERGGGRGRGRREENLADILKFQEEDLRPCSRYVKSETYGATSLPQTIPMERSYLKQVLSATSTLFSPSQNDLDKALASPDTALPGPRSHSPGLQ